MPHGPAAGAAAPRERLKPVDVAWLRMDQPNNLMQINGVLTFDGPADVERVRRLIGERLTRIRRFRQRVVARGNRFYWEDDPEFDLDRHVVVTPLPPPGDETAAQILFGQLLAEPLDRAHPLWKFHVIDGFEGGTAIFGRLHHAIGDGVALMLVLLSLCDLEPGGPPAADASRIVDLPPNPLADLFGEPGERLAALRRLTEDVMPDTMRLVLNPVEALRKTNPLLKTAAGAMALGKLALYPPDARTPLRGPLVVEKRAGWSRRLEVADVKAVGRALGGTVNDVLLAAVGGGLRRYLAREREPAEDLVIRALMPVNLRPLEKLTELGNRFGLVFLGLPVGIADPRRRLVELKRRADALKRSLEPLVVYGLLHAIGMGPLAIERLALRIFGAKGTAVMTNVPGPRRVLYFAGHALEDLFFWVPQSAQLGLGIAICSYRGRVRLGFGADAGLVPDASLLVNAFHEEWSAMEELARDGAPAAPAARPAHV